MDMDGANTMMTMTPDLLGIHALAAVLRAIPQGRAWEHVERDVAVVLGKDAGAVPWRTVINDASRTLEVLVVDDLAFHSLVGIVVVEIPGGHEWHTERCWPAKRSRPNVSACAVSGSSSREKDKNHERQPR